MTYRTSKQAALLRFKITAEYAERGIVLSQELQNTIESYSMGVVGYKNAPSAEQVRLLVINRTKGK